MEDIVSNKVIVVEQMIYEIRGKQVMLDSDLAKLYECKNGTKSINLAVSRNIERFPNDFYFQLTKEEYNNLKFQNETSSLNKEYGGVRKNPYVFSEQGVAMLATVLRTKVAANMSVTIMRAFVKMRKYMSSSLIEQQIINHQVMQNMEDIKLLKKTLKKLNGKTTDIYFEGQIYDAYSKIQSIFNKATKKIVIIDSYADNTLLDIIKRLNVEVVVITKSKSLLSKQDIEKYNEQYHNLTIYYNDSFHDRYFIIDNKVFYHCGASINRIGYKTFSIT